MTNDHSPAPADIAPEGLSEYLQRFGLPRVIDPEELYKRALLSAGNSSAARAVEHWGACQQRGRIFFWPAEQLFLIVGNQDLDLLNIEALN